MKTTASIREMRESTVEDLTARVARLEEELFGHRMKRFTNQLENTAKINQTRREIARAKTIIANRKRGAETQAAASTTEQEK